MRQGRVTHVGDTLSGPPLRQTNARGKNRGPKTKAALKKVSREMKVGDSADADWRLQNTSDGSGLATAKWARAPSPPRAASACGVRPLPCPTATSRAAPRP